MNACACMIDFEAKFNFGIVSILADFMSQQFRHTENIVNEQIAKNGLKQFNALRVCNLSIYNIFNEVSKIWP